MMFSYNHQTKVFIMKINPRNPQGKYSDSATDIVIPKSIYDHGYSVEIKNGMIASPDNDEHLLVKNSNTKTVEIKISPRRGQA
jgi:hypothetical protein